MIGSRSILTPEQAIAAYSAVELPLSRLGLPSQGLQQAGLGVLTVA